MSRWLEWVKVSDTWKSKRFSILKEVPYQDGDQSIVNSKLVLGCFIKSGNKLITAVTQKRTVIDITRKVNFRFNLLPIVF